MSSVLLAFFAYLLDKLFGEFECIKHPIIHIGEYIGFFEKHFYKDSVIRGALLTSSLLMLLFLLTTLYETFIKLFPFVIELIFSSVIASMFLAHNMLHKAVADVAQSKQPRKALSYLVSRDTKVLSKSEVHKASIETYAENLNDAVIAPLFYLLCFGLPGLVLFKGVNTLDSMVGYRTNRYENFGKVSARLDDLAGFIPARITAALLWLLSNKKFSLKQLKHFAPQHESPNAGWCISAMALSLDVSLGGPTQYFGKIKPKPFFGSGREVLTQEDVFRALSFKIRLDYFILGLLGVYLASSSLFY